MPQTIWTELHEYEAPKATISVFSHEQSFKYFMCLYYIQRLLFDQERLQLTNRQLEEEVGRLKVGWATILGRNYSFWMSMDFSGRTRNDHLGERSLICFHFLFIIGVL